MESICRSGQDQCASPNIQVSNWNKLSLPHKVIQQDLYLQRGRRQSDKTKRLRKALKEHTVSHTVSAIFAGIEIKVKNDIHDAEERYEDLT